MFIHVFFSRNWVAIEGEGELYSWVYCERLEEVGSHEKKMQDKFKVILSSERWVRVIHGYKQIAWLSWRKEGWAIYMGAHFTQNFTVITICSIMVEHTGICQHYGCKLPKYWRHILYRYYCVLPYSTTLVSPSSNYNEQVVFLRFLFFLRQGHVNIITSLCKKTNCSVLSCVHLCCEEIIVNLYTGS